MRERDPIFIAPRPIARDWGRVGLGEWSGLLQQQEGPVGEVWISHHAYLSTKGEPDDSMAMGVDATLGPLGRAPPLARLVFPGRRVRMASTPPTSFWVVLDPGQTEVGPVRQPGERIFAHDGACIDLAPASISLEVIPAVLPENASKVITPLTWRPAAAPRMRATLQRDKALSVEMWTLPPRSRLKPDGNCCHVVIAVSQGIMIDDKLLRPGEALMVPASGRAVDILSNSRDARVVVAYPDMKFTDIWCEATSCAAAAEQMPDPRLPPGA